MEDIERAEERGERPVRAAPSSLNAELLDQLADAVLVADADGRYVEANLAAATLVGYTRAEILSMSVTELVAGPRERSEAEFARFSQTGYWRGLVDLRRKDGSVVAVEARASVLETAEGRWGISVLRETNEEVQVPIRAAERRLAAIVQSSDDAIFSVSPDGLIDAWNPAAERLYGYRTDEILGKHVEITAPPERRGEVQENIDRATAGEHVRDLETVRLAKGDRRVDVSLTISPIFDSEGKVTGMSTIARDITDRKRAEQRTHTLYQLTRLVDRAGSESEILEALLDALQRTLPAARAAGLLDEDGRLRCRLSRGLSAELRDAVEELTLWPDHGVPEPVTIPDVRLAPELSDRREAFEDEDVRGLASLPIVHAGTAIGGAVVCFGEPRDLSSDESGFATALCGQAGAALVRLRAERALADARDTLELVTVGAADGITIQDTSGRLVYANLAAARLSGYDSVDDFLAVDPRERLAHWVILDEQGDPLPVDHLPGRRVLAGEPEDEAVLRVHDRRTGSEFWSLVKATATFDAEGRVRYAINLFRDITGQKLTERAAQRQADQMSNLYAITAALSATTDAVVIADALADQTLIAFEAVRGAVVVRSHDGASLETIASRGYDPSVIERWARFPLDASTPVGDAVLRNEPIVMPDRETWMERYPGLARSRVPASAAAIPLDVGGRAIGALTLSFDEPREFTAGDIGFMLGAARQGAQALERARSEVVRSRAEERLAILAQAGGLLADSLDYPKTLAAVADLVVPRLADWASVEILEPDGTIRHLALSHVDPEKVALAMEVRHRRRPDLSQPTGVGHVIATGQPELVSEISEETIEALEDPELIALIRKLQLRSAMTVPLSARGRTLGAMSYIWAESDNRYSATDLAFAQTLAARMALVIDNARLYRDRDHIARTLQQSLLPTDLPAIEGAEIAARYRASGEGVDVGGDFYDAFEIGNGEWTIALGDVCGKGPDAAALMGMVRHTIRAAAIRERAPARVLATVNDSVGRQTSEHQFCTAVAARLRPQDDQVIVWICVAGHPSPVVVRGDGSLQWIRGAGALLGVFEDAELAEEELRLHPGDTLVLYTDGVTDERGARGGFGEEGLAAVLEEAARSTAAEIVDGIERAVLAHGSGEPRDDVAILAVRATG